MQRVIQASVSVEEQVVGRIDAGLLVLCAASVEDDETSAAKMADRIWGARIFSDADGKMNLALKDLPEAAAESQIPSVLAVSNFTIYGDTTQRRPSFIEAAPYERAKALFDCFVNELRSLGCRVETGQFGANMRVELVNDGPVTVIFET